MQKNLRSCKSLKQLTKPSHLADIKSEEVLHVPLLIMDLQEVIQHWGVQTCVIAERTGLLPPTMAGHQSAERL